MRRNVTCVARSLPQNRQHDSGSYISMLEQKIFDLKRRRNLSPPRDATAGNIASVLPAHLSPATDTSPTTQATSHRDFDSLTLHTVWEGEFKAGHPLHRSIYLAILAAAMRNPTQSNTSPYSYTDEAFQNADREFRHLLQAVSTGSCEQYLRGGNPTTSIL